MPKSQRVRQYAIAEELGISRSTVSKVFARRNDVSEETRKRVMEAAETMGYQKSERRRVDPEPVEEAVVGVLIRLGPESPRGHQPDYLHGLSGAAMKHNATLIVHCIGNDVDESAFFEQADLQPAAMRSGRLDGALLAGTWTENGMLSASQSMPTVGIAFGTHQSTIDAVEPDTLSAMRTVINHLADQGHERIAFVGLCSTEYWTIERFAGYTAALAARELTLPPWAVLKCTAPALLSRGHERHWAETTEQVKSLVEKHGVTAVVCSSDWAAYNLHHQFGKLGIVVPRDLSLTGFDDHELDTLGCPRVTSIHIPRGHLAELALQKLLERCRNPESEIRRSQYSCSFMDHGTTAAADS